MKCIYCQAQMKNGTVPYHVDRHGYHLTLDKVPAKVCSQCGEHILRQKKLKKFKRQSVPWISRHQRYYPLHEKMHSELKYSLFVTLLLLAENFLFINQSLKLFRFHELLFIFWLLLTFLPFIAFIFFQSVTVISLCSPNSVPQE